MNARLSLLLPLLSAFLLPSCSTVTWNIGESIRRSGEVRVGVDVRQPVDGKLYTPPREPERKLLCAPVVTYVPDAPLVDWELQQWGDLRLFADMEERDLPVTELTPTGRVVVAETGRWNRRLLRVLPELPVGCEAEEAPESSHLSAQTLGTLERRQHPGLARRLTAAPFDYVIDPVLSLVSTVAVGVPEACAMTLWLPIHVYVFNGSIK